MQSRRSGYEADISVAESGQVLNSLPDAVLIVNLQKTDAGLIGSHIDKHQRDSAGCQLLEERFFNTEGHDRHAFNFALDHALNAARHPFRVIVGRAHEDFIPVTNGDILESLNQFREEWIGDFGDDQAKNSAPAGNQRPGLGVGKIVQTADGIPYTFSHCWIDSGVQVDRSRDRGDRYFGALRNRPNVHGSVLIIRASSGFWHVLGTAFRSRMRLHNDTTTLQLVAKI